MSSQLHMVEMQLDMVAMHRFLQSQNLNSSNDEDYGYGLHAWLAATFGSQAIKPFRLFQGMKDRPPRLLGYTSIALAELANRAQEFASPLALSVCDINSALHSKAMPLKWVAGRHLSFNVLACPVSRKDGVEKDIFLRAIEQSKEVEGLERSQIYLDWLTKQFNSSAFLSSLELEGFQLTSHLRKGESRKATNVVRPRVDFKGVLEVKDSEKFSEILVRGIGRHRSFGYGMLLLGPVQ